MTLFIVVLPLRLTATSPNRRDFASMMAQYIDAEQPGDFTSSQDCIQDLKFLSQLRMQISNAIYEKDGHAEALPVLESIHQYYHGLLQAEKKGLFGSDAYVSLEWESALSGELQTLGSLEWERANILWNLAAIEAYQASKQSLDSKVGWSKAAQHLQNAASLLQHVPSDGFPVLDFSATFIRFWQALLMAQSQRCVYEGLACAPRPRHLLLAKLAAAAVPLFADIESIVQTDETSSMPILNSLACSSLTNNWVDFCRAWGMYMSSKAEYHQAMASHEKKEWGQALARFDLAYRFATLCLEYCERVPLIALQQLHTAVDATVKDLKERIDKAEEENVTIHHKPVPKRQELTEIRGEKLVNIDQPLEKLLKPYEGEELFQVVAASSSGNAKTSATNIRTYVDMFYTEMDKLISQMSNVAEERTESARKALATVNLPHSLTAYRQEHSGGGIPEDLWQRVQSIQRERRIAKLKQDLWQLRDVAEVARTAYQKIENQLDFDLESDRLFREDNPGFEGHDAEEVQKSFRQSLANYQRLLLTAEEGDSVLLRRLEILDTNPKYKLLQFQKSQLDRLLPGAGQAPSTPQIDTSHLSRLLVELSALFHEREVLLNTIREEVKNFDIQGTLQGHAGSGTDQEYRDALKYAHKSFDIIVYELQSNIEKQTELVNTILAANDQFMMARARTANSQQSGDSCISMIEDAIEEIDQLSKHLKEGKDFYDVIIPKLDKLQTQVGDVSARLTVERLEFDDKANRNRQEAEDAMMAKRLASSTSKSDPDGPAKNRGPAGMTPVVTSNGQQVFVDDEKIATLIAMDFDPEKVVQALAKHNNNVDQALNELLSSC